MAKKTTKDLNLRKENRQTGGGGGQRHTRELVEQRRAKRYGGEAPAWSGLRGGMKENLPAAVRNAQQWSDQQDENAMTSYRADEKFVPQKPAWMNSGLRGGMTEQLRPPAWLSGQRPPAYGGSYDPTIRPRTEGGGEEQWRNPYSAAPVNNSTSDTLRGMRPEVGMPGYTGVPVNNSYSDTLRGITPIQRGNSMSFSDLLRSLAAGQQYSQMPFNKPAAWSGNGFGTTYGGNWGGGGGGGWGGDYPPAWLNDDMGLYSWKFG